MKTIYWQNVSNTLWNVLGDHWDLTANLHGDWQDFKAPIYQGDWIWDMCFWPPDVWGCPCPWGIPSRLSQGCRGYMTIGKNTHWRVVRNEKNSKEYFWNKEHLETWTAHNIDCTKYRKEHHPRHCANQTIQDTLANRHFSLSLPWTTMEHQKIILERVFERAK